MSNFSFGNINVNSSKHVINLEAVINPIVVDKSSSFAGYDVPITILLDEYYDEKKIKYFDNFLAKNGIKKYIMLGVLNCKITKDDIKEKQKCGIIEFYKNNRSNYEKFIPRNSPIITSGPALYAHLREDDIYPSHVQQRVFGKSYFWFSYTLSEKGNWIYPIESLGDLFITNQSNPIDSYKTNLAKLQFKDAIISKREPPKYPHLIKHFIQSKEEFYSVFYEPNKDRKGVLAWDLETSGLNPYTDKIGCITLSFDGVEGYYIPWKYVDKEKLDEIFKNNKNLGANLKFDVEHAILAGLKNARVDEDVISIGHTLDETRSNSLKALAFYYSEYGGYERALDSYKDTHNLNNYLEIPEDILKEYAIMDAIVTYRVWVNIMRHMRLLDKKYPNEKYPANNLERYYYDRRIPADNLYADMELRGMCVNKPKLDALRKEMTEYVANVKKDLAESLGVPANFNFDSAEKLGKLLEEKGWEDWGRNKKGIYNTSDFQLDRWAKNHEEARRIQDMRGVSQLLKTFVGDDKGTTGWSQYLQHRDWDKPDVWRIHSSYFPMGTDTGRTRCTKPNLQNTPTRGLFAKEIKSCICTPDDDKYVLVTCDYSALQMRLATIDSSCKGLTDAFLKPGADAHSMTAINAFCNERKFELEEVYIEDEDENQYTFLGHELIKVQRGLVEASSLTEDDSILGNKIKSISKKTINREITFDDFVKIKHVQPFKNYRQNAKTINFLMLFGGSCMVLAQSKLETEWSLKECEDFIKENHCEEDMEVVKATYKHISDAELPYVTVAKRLRDNFFKGYPELMDRLVREKDYASKRGFCRSFFGATRNLIELMLKGKYDEKEFSLNVRNLENMSGNAPIQNMEVCISKKALWRIWNRIKDEKLDAYIWNEIHDSCDLVVAKKDLKRVLEIIKYELEKPVPELAFSPIKLTVDCEVSDLTVGDYYKGGRDPSDFGIDWEHLADDADYNQEGYDRSDPHNFDGDLKWLAS